MSRSLAPLSTARDRSERALIAVAVRGSHAAFDELGRRYRPRVLRFAHARLGDAAEAEDVAQEVFLEAYRALAGYRGEGTFWSWLASITHRRICARYRERARRAPEPAGAAEALAERAAPLSTPSEAWLDARLALERCGELAETRLPPAQRRMFQLRYRESRSVRAIALALGKTPGAVKVGLLRSRAKLQQDLPQLEQSAP